MIEEYEQVSPGWLYQKNITGQLKEYNLEYIKPYEKYDNTLSKFRLNFCENYAYFKTILDVGYGDGNFLKLATTNGYRCYGNDISGYSLPSYVKLTDNRNIPVDLVTFFDCIEHFKERNIDKVLSELNTTYLCLTVPWCHYTEDMTKFENWKHRKPNEHFHHFDARGISELLNKSGYNLITLSSFEDQVRKGSNHLPNILTVMAKKCN